MDNPEYVDELRRRAELVNAHRGTGVDMVAKPAPALLPKDNPEFVLPAQHVALVAMCAEACAPQPVDPTRPALRVYGTFASVEEAREHSDTVIAMDPTCSLYAVPCREWTLLPRISSGAAEAAVEARCAALLAAHARKVESVGASFEARRRAVVSGVGDEERRRAASAPPVATRDDADEADAEALVYPKLKRIGVGAEVRGQRYVCLTLLPEANGECLFQVLGCFDTADDALEWTHRVASQSIVDTDIVVHATCEWMSPNGIARARPAANKVSYRNSELQVVMDGLKSCNTHVRDFAASDLSTGAFDGAPA